MLEAKPLKFKMLKQKLNYYIQCLLPLLPTKENIDILCKVEEIQPDQIDGIVLMSGMTMFKFINIFKDDIQEYKYIIILINDIPRDTGL